MKYFVHDTETGIVDWFRTHAEAENCIMELKEDCRHESSGRIDDSIERLLICKVTHKAMIIDNGTVQVQEV